MYPRTRFYFSIVCHTKRRRWDNKIKWLFNVDYTLSGFMIKAMWRKHKCILAKDCAVLIPYFDAKWRCNKHAQTVIQVLIKIYCVWNISYSNVTNDNWFGMASLYYYRYFLLPWNIVIALIHRKLFCCEKVFEY